MLINRQTLLLCSLLLIAGCATNPLSNARYWKLEQCADSWNESVIFNQADGSMLASIPRATCLAVRSVVVKIQREADLKITQIYIADINELNAIATNDKSGNLIAIITIGMFRELGADEDAWAGLMGHEMAHFFRKHGESRRNAQAKAKGRGQAVASILASLIPGMGGVVAGAVGGTTTQWAVYGAYTRPQEAEADHLGLTWMVAAGYDPRGLSRLFDVLSKQPTLPAFLSTHPSNANRAKAVHGYINRARK